MSTGAKTKVKGSSSTSIWPSTPTLGSDKKVREIKSAEEQKKVSARSAPSLVPKLSISNVSAEQKAVDNVPLSNFNIAINSESKSADDNSSSDNLIGNVNDNASMSVSLQVMNSDPHPIPPNNNNDNHNSNASNVSDDKFELLQQSINGLAQLLHVKMDHVNNNMDQLSSELGQLSNEVNRNRRDSQLFEIRMDHTLYDIQTNVLAPISSAKDIDNSSSSSSDLGKSVERRFTSPRIIPSDIGIDERRESGGDLNTPMQAEQGEAMHVRVELGSVHPYITRRVQGVQA